MAFLPLIAYAGGCGVQVLYHGRQKTIKERINMIMLYCMESGSGKSVIIRWMDTLLEALQDKIAALKFYEHKKIVEEKKKNKQCMYDKENVTQNQSMDNTPSFSDRSYQSITNIALTPSTQTDVSDVTSSTSREELVESNLQEVRRCIQEWKNLPKEMTEELLKSRAKMMMETGKQTKEPKFLPPQLIIERITYSALVDHLGCNLEGRYAAFQLVDEATTTYKNAFDPDFIGKNGGEYFLDKSFLIKLFDGSRISNETKEAIRSKNPTHVKRHGITSFMGIQPVPWIESLMFKDEEGASARMFTFLAERVKFDATNEEMDEDKEDDDLAYVMSRLNHPAPRNGSINVRSDNNEVGELETQLSDTDSSSDEKETSNKGLTYQLADDIEDQESAEFDIVDVLYAVYRQHPTDDQTMYEIKGAANKIGAVIVSAEYQLDKNVDKQNIPAWKRRWLGKTAAKVMRLTWPIHVLVSIYSNCITKQDLRHYQIPRIIDSNLVAQIALEIYVNATRTYEIPFEFRDAREKEDDPKWQIVASKILRSEKDSLTKRHISTSWMHKKKYFDKESINKAIAFLRRNDFIVMSNELDIITKIVDIKENGNSLTSKQVMALDSIGINVIIE